MSDTGQAALSEQLAEIAIMVERGNLDRAQSSAQGLLLQNPNSASVHAILGDIAAARREHREAIDWYELALRLQPNAALQMRLERQRELLAQGGDNLAGQAEEEPANRRKWLVAGIGGGVLILALLIALIAGSLMHRGRPERPRGQFSARPVQAAGPQTTQASPPGQRPATQPGSPTTGPNGVGIQSPVAAPPVASNAPGPRLTQSVDAPMADRDRLLTRSLSSLTWSSGEQLSWRIQATVDPFTGYALVSLEVPPGMRRSAQLSDSVIDMAYKVAVATIRADQGVETLTIRVLAEVDNEAQKRKTVLVAFRGNTSRQMLDYYLKRGLQPDRSTIWSSVFATTWWNPSVPSGAH